MKNAMKIIIVVGGFSILPGCAATLLATSFDNSKEISDEKLAVNQQALHAIQLLRALQGSRKQSYTFIYGTNNEQLPPVDRYKFIQLLNGLNNSVIVKIGPAKASSSWQQLSLTNKRAAALKQLITNKVKLVNIIFVPELSNDTVNIVVGA